MKMETQKIILIADTSYVQFRNFELNQLYKKTVTLQNVTTSPARFQIAARPYRSMFQVFIKSVKKNRNIIPPGMQIHLIILFRCNVIDEPEEMLVLNVQHGKPLVIRLHGCRDPPILMGIDETQEACSNSLEYVKEYSSHALHTELLQSFNSTNDTTSSSSESEASWNNFHTIFRSMILDCKKGFVGEEIHVPMKFRNIGGEGTFFIMSEIDWVSMHIEDITDKNVLILPSFLVWPAYFSMKSQQIITLHTYFLPHCYGIHVDKLYILSDNCNMLATEIIGDGITYETDFIQLSKVSTSLFANSIISVWLEYVVQLRCNFLVEKKTFVIKNETPIPCNFRLRVKNFYPVDCSCERKSQEDRIKFIYKQVYGRNKDLIEETLCRLKQPRSGVVIYVDPPNSDIERFEAIPVDIYVFADTWGTYIDELDIDIAGLPRYTLAICVQVAELPISLSICERTSTSTCVIKFGTVATGIRLQPRKILVKNTSVVPIAVDWHSFLVMPKTETMPFNVVFDLYTPFTNKLARQLVASKWKSKNETCIEEHVTNSVKSEIKSGSDSFGRNDSIAEVSSASPSASHEATTSSCTISSKLSTSWTWNDCDLNSLESSKSHEYIKDETNVYSHEIDQNQIENANDTEFKISIIPYYGAVDTEVCLVTPREIFISPKDNASVTITVQPHQCDFLNASTNFTGELFCKILGFPRIAPSDKYRDNCYARLDGTYLTPIEINVTANIVKPQLIFDIPTYDRTFACCANDMMQSRWKTLILKKTFFFYNKGNNMVGVSFATYNPFHIESVSIYAETNICSPIKDICINGHGCAEVVISCTVKEELIETLLHTNKIQDLHDAVLIVKEPLSIIHSDDSTQEVELILHIWLPSLKLSIYTLEFGPVYVGNTKKLILVVENLSICSYKFNIIKKSKNKEFMVDQEEGILTSHCTRGSCIAITVSFQPKKAGQSVETLQIIVNNPHTMEECELNGEGSLDEKYCIPGT
ncbi:uncharacterized protein LOC143342856 [Colletes latitarsis]|uniref:uncharacterized protein LOC143342856 n=1 Tax=Colletes latitarsis TaxID=2605962 RepID=UPI004037595A